jgi:hypothetical protein
LASMGLIGCAARQPDPPRSCSTLDDCERVYAEELAAYNACRDSGYGARCEDEESRMNAAYEQRGRVETTEQTRDVAEAERQRELAMEADRKAQAAEQQQIRDDRQALVDASRAEDEQRAKEAAERLAAEEQATKAQQEGVADKARQLGFDQIVYLERGGLITYLLAVIDEGIDAKTLTKTVIELSDRDSAFAAMSVQGGEGLFAWDDSDPRLFFRAPKGKTIYDGTSLTSLVEAVRITGVRSYRTVLGASVQAFVVVPVW